MASNSQRRSASSDRSPERKRVQLGRSTRDPARAAGSRKPQPRANRSEGRAETAAARRKRLERESRLRQQRLVTSARIAGIGLVVAACVWGLVALYRSDLLGIDRVSIVGNSRLSEEEILAAARVPADATLLRFPGDAVAERLLKDPWVSAVDVRRIFPDGMRITIEERVPVALVDDGDATFWLVDDNGFVVAQRTIEDSGALTVIRDVEGLDATPGEVSESEALRNAIDVLVGLSPELRARVRAVSAPTVEKTAVYTTEDVEIFFGSADDIETKDALAMRILTENAGKVVYINVRSISRPTWRGLEGEQ